MGESRVFLPFAPPVLSTKGSVCAQGALIDREGNDDRNGYISYTAQPADVVTGSLVLTDELCLPR